MGLLNVIVGDVEKGELLPELVELVRVFVAPKGAIGG